MKGTILASWSPARIIKLLLGSLALFQGFKTSENIFLFAGGFVLITALFNVDCYSNTCSVKANKKMEE
jgi:hypothetical protein